jgi:hypothetical protein
MKTTLRNGPSTIHVSLGGILTFDFSLTSLKSGTANGNPRSPFSLSNDDYAEIGLAVLVLSPLAWATDKFKATIFLLISASTFITESLLITKPFPIS